MTKGEIKMTGKHVVFISMPMNGMTDDDIIDNLQRAKEEYLRRCSKTIGEVAFESNVGCPLPPKHVPENRHGVWYLGVAISKMSSCDEAFFYGNWREARGCKIEYAVSRLYDIPVMEV
jgi:hypothetical protein